MLISHEIPKVLFPYHDLISDYPYVLSHLLQKDKEYAAFYKKKLSTAPYSILDCSTFELGKSVDQKELLDNAIEYKPTHLVLPDTLHDYEATIKASTRFIENYKSTLIDNKIKTIGVLQGNSFHELLKCHLDYLRLGADIVDMIAIPFDCIKDSDWHNIRYQFFKELSQVTDFGYRKYHFLGLENPSELSLYDSGLRKHIFSIDTSSPIINGWVGNEYGNYGLKTEKPKVKLADSLDISFTDDQIQLIVKNVLKFKQLANG